VKADQIDKLLKAKDTMLAGEGLVSGDNCSTSDFTAISKFEKSRDLFAAAGDICEAAIAENWAVQMLPGTAKIAESRQRLTSIIANAESRKFNVLLPAAYYWLAVSDFSQNGYSRSNKNFKAALRLAKKDNNSFEAQHAAENLTLNYSELGELESALSYAGEMISVKGTYYENPGQSWRNLGTLADLSLKLKFFRTSWILSREALSVVQENWPGTRRVNSALRHLVRAATANEDFAAALEYANESKRLALKCASTAEQTRTIAESYLLSAGVESQMKSYDQAIQDYDHALEFYGHLPEFTFDLYQIHKGKLFCFQQLGRREDFSRELQTVLGLAEEYRATIREDDSRRTFFANEQEVFDVAAANEIEEGNSRRAFAFVEESRARSLLDFVKSNKPIAEVENDFGQVTHPLLLPEIQARLPEQVEVVQYAVLPDKLAIWVLSPTRFDLIEKPIKASDLEQKIDDYQSAVLRKASAAELEQTAKELYQLLIPPNLSPDKQICLVPDKSLHRLAFASLVSPVGRYLLEDFAVFYAPSASVLVLATENARRKNRNTNESLLSVGNPDFDREENPNLAPLESAEVEARSIGAEYEQKLQLLGSEATKERFLPRFTDVDVIHFAGHFLANPQSPGNSRLLFAGSDLRTSELSGYKLRRAKLVVLSACETGFERYDKSEGAIGIARTFLALGAPVVIATQWKVDSEPTKDLMIAFHRNRKHSRSSSAESLRLAQLQVLRNGPTQAPYYWAAFSLFGGYANY